jgi:urease accessory protein
MSAISTAGPGTAHLQFTSDGSATVIARSFASSPAKLIATKARAATCWVYAATLGGGLVGGDELQLTVEVKAGARALITTQASTKVYRSLRPSKQTINAVVDERALLAVAPDPIVCFAEADFTQRQRYDLRGDASLVVVDWMTSGRHGCGERWAFSRYESRLEIARDSRQVVFDGLVLERDLDRVAGRMSRFDVILTAVITGPLCTEACEELVARTSREPVVPGAALVVSAARLCDGGTLVRMAGVSVEQLGRTLRDYLAFLPPLTGNDLWSRKW